MPIPSQTLKAYEMTRVDQAIMAFAKIDKPTSGDLMSVRCVAQIEENLDAYRAAAAEMPEAALRSEAHDSETLARHMESVGDRRPADPEVCHCHAIVSGRHKRAAQQRAVMAWAMMRIDDPRNGCWLPRNTAAKPKMPNWLRDAVPHSRIHRKTYYFWLDQVININTINDVQDLADKLRVIRVRLQTGAVPVLIKQDMKV